VKESWTTPANFSAAMDSTEPADAWNLIPDSMIPRKMCFARAVALPSTGVKC